MRATPTTPLLTSAVDLTLAAACTPVQRLRIHSMRTPQHGTCTIAMTAVGNGERELFRHITRLGVRCAVQYSLVWVHKFTIIVSILRFVAFGFQRLLHPSLGIWLRVFGRLTIVVARVVVAWGWARIPAG